MKRLMFAFAALVFAVLPSLSQATVIDFNNGLDPFFTYSSVILTPTIFPNSGYGHMAVYTGGGLGVLNPSAAPLATFTKAGPGSFDLDSFLIDGAWGTQTLTFQGWSNGSMLYTASAFITPDPLLVILRWNGIDQFKIAIGDDYVTDTSLNGSGRHWVLDNMVVNDRAANVPEPGSLALFGLGLIAAGASLRRAGRGRVSAG
jgi:hypothetical protein